VCEGTVFIIDYTSNVKLILRVCVCVCVCVCECQIDCEFLDTAMMKYARDCD